MTDNMDEFLAIFPPRITEALRQCIAASQSTATPFSLAGLVEIIADLGRRAEARFYNGSAYLGDQLVDAAEIQQVVDHLSGIGKDNRAGIEATLHRISVIRSRQGRIIGLTCRVGRAVYGSAEVLRDVFTEGKSVLLLGSPGVGKTTLLREIARVLADDYRKRVVIVDTSNEIAGDGDIPHAGIGGARRMPVSEPSLQHSVMVEAVENHMPEVVVIDEIGTEAETYAARTIAERGVMLVATAHGLKLENLLQNPTLSDLIGGIQSVTLSDEEAKRRKSRKSVLERKAPPTFGVIVEVRERNLFAIHRDVEQVVDSSLRGVVCEPEVRCRREDGSVSITHKASTPSNAFQPVQLVSLPSEPEEDDDPLDDGDLLEELRAAGWLHVGEDKSRLGEGQADMAETDEDTSVKTRERRDIYRDDEAEGGFRLAPLPPGQPDLEHTVRIYPYGISHNRLQSLIDTLGIDARIAGEWHDCDMVLTVRGTSRRRDPFFTSLRNLHLPVHFLRGNTVMQLQSFLEDFFKVRALTPSEMAKRELDRAIAEVKRRGRPVDLSPQELKLRRLQHRVAEAAGLVARSYGNEPSRYVRISAN